MTYFYNEWFVSVYGKTLVYELNLFGCAIMADQLTFPYSFFPRPVQLLLLTTYHLSLHATWQVGQDK